MADDGSEKNLVCEICCCDFCIAMTQTYLDLVKMALKRFIPFATIYEYETAFFTLLHYYN